MTTIIKKMDGLGCDVIPFLLGSSIHGDCYHFAIALYRGLGWDIIGLKEGNNIIHAGVRSPEGNIWDGRGEVSEKNFIKPFRAFLRSSSCCVFNVTEKELLATGTVKDFSIEFLQKKAQIVWPELPWKQETFQDRVVAFANELEELSRKYKLWICKTFPPDFPVIAEGNDDETGYEIKPTIDGHSFTINRVIG